MTANFVGQHEDSVPSVRLRNKRIALVDYNDVFDVKLICNYKNEVEAVDIFYNSEPDLALRVECAVVLPPYLYHIFEDDLFNSFIPHKREQIFKELVKYINRGH